MFTLQNFYHSKTWTKFTKVIKAERVNPDGNIICDYCKKPIVHKYDCICHHNIQLNDMNVNNADISLNPNNISLVHHRCHNLIHCKFQRKDKKVYLVFGAPCSGKTTFVNNNMLKGDIVLDIDSIWEALSAQERYTKPYQIKQIVLRVRDLIIDSIKYRLGDWANAYIIGGYPLKSERERLIKELCAEEIFIDCTKEECMNRLRNSDKRDYREWSKYIDDWFNVYESVKYV